jgi:hypothetical protein
MIEQVFYDEGVGLGKFQADCSRIRRHHSLHVSRQHWLATSYPGRGSSQALAEDGIGIFGLADLEG